MTRLSVVIPSHKRADLLRECLAAVVRFAPVRTQIIVVDDASPGGIVSAAAAAFPGVTVIRRAKSGGFCAAANAGIAAATGDVVEMLNDDAVVTPGWADAALKWFADPRIGAVAPLVLQYESDAWGITRIDSAGDEYDRGGFARKRGHNLPVPGSGPLAEPGPVWGVSAAAGFYRRDALVQAGAFPELFGAYFEDVDLSFRLRRLGYAVQYEPASRVRHRVSASYGSRPSRRVLEQQSRNEELVWWRNVRGADRWRSLPRHAAVLAGKAARRWTEGNLVPWAIGRVRGLAATMTP